MEVYMTQKVIENYDTCEYDSHEELFYTWKDANEYMEVLFEEELRILTERYCDPGENIDEYCDIDEWYEHKSIHMESEFWIAFNIYKKTIMSFS